MAAPPPSSQQQHLPARCVLTGMLNAQYNHHVCRRLPQRELHEALRTDTDAKREAVALGNGRVIAVRAESVHPLPSARAYVVIGGHVGGEVENALYEATGLPRDFVARVVRCLAVAPVKHAEVRAVACSSVATAGPDYSFGAAETLVRWPEDVRRRREAWISAPGTFVGGEGAEWIEYELAGGAAAVSGTTASCGAKSAQETGLAEEGGDCDAALLDPRLRRLRTVGVRVPVPPAGPLAAKCFHLEAPMIGVIGEQVSEYVRGILSEHGQSGDGWMRVSDDFTLLLDEPGSNPMYEWAVATWAESLEMQLDRVRLVFTENFTGAHNPWADSVGLWEVTFGC